MTKQESKLNSNNLIYTVRGLFEEYKKVLPKKEYFNFPNLSEKKLIFIGYDDWFPFNTKKELEKIKIKKNNIYLVEFPQTSYNAFQNSKTIDEMISELNQDTGISKLNCKNPAKLLNFSPANIYPCADNSKSIFKRDLHIFQYLTAWIRTINDNLKYFNDFNDIVFFGGATHVKHFQDMNLEDMMNIQKNINIDNLDELNIPFTGKLNQETIIELLSKSFKEFILFDFTM